MNLQDWALAASGTFLFMLVDEGGTPMLGALGAVLMLLGLVIHCSAKLSLRRSFGLVAANRGIKVGGAYRIVRHPMYAGYILAHIGFLLTSPTLWNLAVYVSGWALLVARIYAGAHAERRSRLSSLQGARALPPGAGNLLIHRWSSAAHQTGLSLETGRTISASAAALGRERINCGIVADVASACSTAIATGTSASPAITSTR